MENGDIETMDKETKNQETRQMRKASTNNN